MLPHLDEGFRVICPDFRGLGDSERKGEVADYEKHHLAADILTLLDGLGVEQRGLVGHAAGFANVILQLVEASHFHEEEAPEVVGPMLSEFFLPLLA